MKRKTASKSQTAPAKTPTIASHRLTAVRGGLGIAADVIRPSAAHMQQQHNEVMIGL
jgi:hypothetical protein